MMTFFNLKLFCFFLETEISLKNDDDILEIASSRIAALAALSSSEGNFQRPIKKSSEKLLTYH